MTYKKIALDGPAGSGKSTVAKKIAHDLGIIYIDTGAMYRAVTLKFMETGVDLNDSNAVHSQLMQMQIDFKDQHLYLDGKDVSEAIRSPEVASKVSAVAAILIVREHLVKMQQAIASNKDIIMDGRDIGTKVLPDSSFKFYITASIEERATRRYKELIEKGYDTSFEQIQNDIASRDDQDMQRKESPLVQAHDAELVDTTGMSISEVVEHLKKRIMEKSEV